MRFFIGIPLARNTADDLTVAVRQLRPEATSDKLRWSAPESWHITLQFLGSATRQQYDCVVDRLRALRHGPVPIQLGALGIFDRTGILFADIRVTPQLLALQQLVTAVTASCGFIPEDRPYHPHITLATRKGSGGGRELRDLKLQNRGPNLSGFTAESFVLYESIPAPGGSRYEIREHFPLRPTPA
jgi:RNA 2',3'-cyclic 3'-phosphodiesterase